MSNWTTAAGIALMAGGLAVLVGFRQILLGRVSPGADLVGVLLPRRNSSPGGSRARATPGEFSAPGQLRARRRRQALATAPAGASAVSLAAYPKRDVEARPEPGRTEDEASGGLAALGFAASDEPDEAEAVGVEGGGVEGGGPATGTLQAVGLGLPAEHRPVPTPRREGDRVEGWVRPEYSDEPISGEYWTPVPEDAYESYGWPVPVDRLPEVPPYPPQSGFDLELRDRNRDDEAGPTRAVPQWPPARPSGRIELPRTWAARNGQTRSTEDDDQERPRRRTPARREGEPQPRRPRPRPRPGPSQENRTNVYRSRHAADPT